MSSFIVPPHLAKYNAPLATFAASNPQFTHFVTGAYIFTQDRQPIQTLLLRRSLTDSYGGYWENPGGSCDAIDKTLLEGAAREVFEETGFHVSEFVDLISVDQWEEIKRGELRKVAKFSFIVVVREVDVSGNWMDGVKLQPTEHQDFVWATAQEVRDGNQGKGRFRFVLEQGGNLVRAFEQANARSS